jgi:hypothetical protein
MKKIIIPIVLLAGISCSNIDETYNLNESLNNIEAMRQWMDEDMSNGIIPEEYGVYYVEWLDNTEDLLVEYGKIKGDIK